jgi:hypothetical protein
MDAPPKKMNLPENNGKKVNPDRSTQARFRVYGVELIEKVVKSSGNSGRIYVPPSWVGKHVKIIRTD